MKKLLTLALIALCFACESDGPEPEVASEIIQPNETAADATAADDQIFLVVEKMAQFEGGIDAWNNYLTNQITYPTQARNEGVQGRVFVTFVVQPDGEITDAQLVRGIGAGCDEEALRVIKESPYWTPGEQRGRKVASRMNVAITFKL